MIKRHLEGICFDEEFGRQMRFISGPRQVGKTTLVRRFLERRGHSHLYFNWDLRRIRDQYIDDAYFFETDVYDSQKKTRLPWVCLDEIHKMPKWKNILKDYFDKFENEARFVVTGSARLDMFRKSGDALTGRYFMFQLFPLCLSEAAARSLPHPLSDESALNFIQRRLGRASDQQDALDHLLEYSGFPEPFTTARARFFRRWQSNMVDQILREDVRDLTRIFDIENIARLIRQLPARIGSPLSLNALREDLNVSYTAVRNALRALQLTFVVFLIPPFHRNVARALTKEQKAYFLDWTHCSDPAVRFENYVAVELKTLTALWRDKGLGDFELSYIRTRDGKETDFLIVKDDKPWCLLEAKWKDGPVDGHHYRQAESLGNIPVVQVCCEAKVLKKGDSSVFRISAGRFFG
ncbi:MAG: ATP-binding protein [Acidobacteriota bacterium]